MIPNDPGFAPCRVQVDQGNQISPTGTSTPPPAHWDLATTGQKTTKKRETEMKLALLTLVSAILVTALAQALGQESPGSITERIHQGDTSAVLEIGQSGDPRAVSLILPLLNDPDYVAKREVRLALAKLGERESLQYFACRSLNGSVRKIEVLIDEDLDYIGGEFTIEIYRQLLDSDQRFLPDMDRTDRKSDALLRLPSSTAMLKLSKLVPDAEIPNPSRLAVQAGRDSDTKKKWSTWIDEHKAGLQKLMPTAEGIVFDSNYCSDFTNATAMDRRLRTITGEGATNCGHVEGDTKSGAADKCVRNTFTRGKPFMVRYEVYQADEDISVGVASDGQGGVYAVAFDDAGVSTRGLGDKVELFDDRHTVVVPCPKPVVFRQSVAKGLTCLSQSGNSLLSPE
jgi:hypothetical protein